MEILFASEPVLVWFLIIKSEQVNVLIPSPQSTCVGSQPRAKTWGFVQCHHSAFILQVAFLCWLLTFPATIAITVALPKNPFVYNRLVPEIGPKKLVM